MTTQPEPTPAPPNLRTCRHGGTWEPYGDGAFKCSKCGDVDILFDPDDDDAEEPTSAPPTDPRAVWELGNTRREMELDRIVNMAIEAQRQAERLCTPGTYVDEIVKQRRENGYYEARSAFLTATERPADTVTISLTSAAATWNAIWQMVIAGTATPELIEAHKELSGVIGAAALSAVSGEPE
jgi:hypothetical protein